MGREKGDKTCVLVLVMGVSVCSVRCGGQGCILVLQECCKDHYESTM